MRCWGRRRSGSLRGEHLMSNLSSFSVQVERLQRHYVHSVNTYDQISLLDLSHVLRVWADLKLSNHLPPVFETTLAFKSAIPIKKLVRSLRNRRYILLSMPHSVQTKASNNELGFTGDGVQAGGNATVGASARFNIDGSLDIDAYYYIEGEIDSAQRELLGKCETSRGNYKQWLGAEVVRLSVSGIDGRITPMSISRENLIRRMANTMDASHPSDLQENNNGNPIDAALAFMMRQSVAGLPVPYFLLLKTAQDILKFVSK
jgi:hypothetical protein